MMRRSIIVIVVTLLAVTSVIVLGGTALAQSSNSELGTWKLNVAKSKFNEGAALKSSTAKIEVAGAGSKNTIDQVSADGTARHLEFKSNYDGKDEPIIGNSANGDTIAVTRVNANTTNTVIKQGGKVTLTQTRVISSDGNTWTVTNSGTNPLGQRVNNVLVYDKQ